MLKRAGIDAARVRALPEEQRNTIGHDADATPTASSPMPVSTRCSRYCRRRARNRC